MTYEEILQAFTSKNDHFFAHITSKLDEIASSSAKKEPLSFPDLEKSEWWQLSNALDLANKLKLEFTNRIGLRRFYRLTAIPSTIQDHMEKLARSEVRNLLLHPEGRDAGWLTAAFPPLIHSTIGLESTHSERHQVRLLNSGTLEFSTPVDDSFCWQQPSDSMKQHPRLYPYAVVEYPLSFCREYLRITELLELSGEVTFHLELYNIRNAVLLPFRPESLGYAMPTAAVRPIEKVDLFLKPATVSIPFSPDKVTLLLLLDLYRAFGYEEKHIPFRKQDGTFEL